MRRVFVRGLGFVSCLGNGREQVNHAIRNGISGITAFEEFNKPGVPVSLAGVVPEFSFPTPDPEDWVYPAKYNVSPRLLRPMSPNALFGYCASKEALADAGWDEEKTKSWKTGLVCASAGSTWLLYKNLEVLDKAGVQKVHPLSIVRSIAGSLNFNLNAAFGMRGGAIGFSTACASSAHALGYATDQIRLGRWDRALVVGAEEVGYFPSLPFAAMRALTTEKDPSKGPRPFDRTRDGFAPCGGSAAIVLEGGDEAPEGAYAEVSGWGESSDGFNVMAPEPNGAGLAEAMRRALQDANLEACKVQYINAHATGTVAGDVAELKAIREVFKECGSFPQVSSTKSLTGHGLSLAGALESGFCSLALKGQFVPPNAKLVDPDPEAEGIILPVKPKNQDLEWVISNSSGFGGSNVSIVLRRV